MIQHPFDPIINKVSGVLILRPFLSIDYGDVHNRFWHLMEALFDEQKDRLEAF